MNYQRYSKVAEQVARQEALKRRTYLSFAVIQNNTVPLKPNNYFIGYLMIFVSFALLITSGIKRYRLLRNTIKLKIDWADWFSPLGDYNSYLGNHIGLTILRIRHKTESHLPTILYFTDPLACFFHPH